LVVDTQYDIETAVNLIDTDIIIVLLCATHTLLTRRFYKVREWTFI